MLEKGHFERDGKTGKRIIVRDRYEPVGEPVPWSPKMAKPEEIEEDAVEVRQEEG